MFAVGSVALQCGARMYFSKRVLFNILVCNNENAACKNVAKIKIVLLRYLRNLWNKIIFKFQISDEVDF